LSAVFCVSSFLIGRCILGFWLNWRFPGRSGWYKAFLFASEKHLPVLIIFMPEQGGRFISLIQSG
jgi:hypothetical protein